jgi:murein tripeptide amidase MpaA
MHTPVRKLKPWLWMILVIAPGVAPRADTARADLVTDFEKSGGRRTATFAQTTAYLARLEDASEWVRVASYGTTPEGRDMQYVVVDRHGRFTPASAHAKHNVVVLIQAGIHSGEIDGKDAGLMLIRAMAVDRSLAGLLDHVTVLFIPIFNLDGHERVGSFNRPNQNGPEEQGFRATARNLNLNRDYMKADAPEMRAWLALFDQWQPDFLIDCHVTDGADYQYVVTYAAEIWPNGDAEVASWSERRFIPPLSKKMGAAGFPLSPYVNLRVWDDLQTGMERGPSTPRFSTGYAALRNRPALLVETHSLKDYATRVKGTYEILRHSLAVIGDESAALRKLVSAADRRSAALEKQTIPVEFELDYTDSVIVDFLGVDYTVEKSDITGGRWVRYSKTPRTWKIPMFMKQKVKATATVPAAYVVPVAWTSVIERIRAHGIAASEITSPVTLDVSTYRFSNVKWEAKPFEGHHTLTYDTTPVTERMTFAPGSLVIDTAQPLGRVLAHLLEPAAPDALVRWGFLDSSFEQKEYFEGYVMEAMIRKMLSSDRKLAAEFKAAKADTAFAGNTERIRDWFYQRSPYRDSRVGLYPIGRIIDRGALEKLPLRQGRS